MVWTIKKKLQALAVVSAGAALLAGGIGFVSLRTVLGSVDGTNNNLDGLQGHMQADMMHDALRADVLSALLGGQSGSPTKVEVERSLAEHTKSFQEAILANEKLALSPEIKAGLAEVTPELARYIAAAQEEVALAFVDNTTAQQRYSSFQRSFESLEGKMAKVSTLIEGSTERAKAASEATATWAQWLILGSILVGAVASFVVAFSTGRKIVNTLAMVSATANKLKDNCISGLNRGLTEVSLGRLGFEVKATTTLMEVDGDDELAELTRTVNQIVEKTQESITAYDSTQSVLKSLLSETDSLVAAGKRGDLSVRGDAARFQGVYNELVAGLNATLEAMLGSVQETLDQVKAGAEREAVATAEQRRQADELRAKVDSMLEVVNAAAQGDLTREITVRGEDAIGQMGEGLAAFFEDLRKSIEAFARNAAALGGSSEELTAVSQQMGSNAEETAAQASVVSAASDEVSRNVQTVAAATEEMSASIREIAKNANEAAKVATQAVRIADTTNTIVGKLGDSSAEIGKVIKVITSIAQQTNLLALNATIEAARAGEAGKGFAVVANEVKELAKETARATEDISQKIEAIQVDTRGAVEAIAEIGAVITQINDISNTIASAVEEQTATTNEIGRNVSEAAKGSAEIVHNITSVAQAAQSTTAGASETRRSSEKLADMAQTLRELVSQFKYEAGSQTGIDNGRRLHAATKGSRAA